MFFQEVRVGLPKFLYRSLSEEGYNYYIFLLQ
ncbi:hypothetical protein SAMN05443144_11225 [Fodinibius roseus]|uniref:Uncharacterized protein n=1 Tax=Fodinibius roseus TaxID=1194090 RepID=A0A1M5DSX2_9BACT|nr:hypothetical protein SAMN05443144_11225 [Fodinibius roseus]